MDKITRSLLSEFAASHQVDDLPEDDQFEHFVAFITLRRHHARAFDTDDIVVGRGADTSIDSIAIIVNGALVTDKDAIEELADRNGTLEVNFVFTQADRGEHFDSSKIGSFGFGVEDFFKDRPTLARNARVSEAAEIWAAILERGSLIRTKPTCRLYFATTGAWQADANNVARINGAKAALESTQLFSTVEFLCYGANDLHKLYNQTKTAVTREFEFRERRELPSVNGVVQSYIGFVPASEFLKIISDDSGDDILGSIFDDNVRDWQDYNSVNQEMKETLESGTAERFVLMNNGVTILTRKIGGVGSKLTIEDFQIVNGCQTSHVIFNQRGQDLSKVSVPLRLIETQDDEVKEAIVKATNRQTELTTEQLYALTDFSRQLELHFKSVGDPHRLYYERREGQYDRYPTEVPKSKIVTPQSLIRAFGAMFLDEPTRVTRNYKGIREKVGREIFARGHRLDPYYIAAYAAYRLDFMLRNRFSNEYKAARYHILMAMRYLMDRRPLPHMGSREMERRCEVMREMIWDQTVLEGITVDAAGIVQEIVERTGVPFLRDNIRTEATTNEVLRYFGALPGRATS
jgi:hypothetical protein